MYESGGPLWSTLTTLFLIALAEFGDKSQLVCMALAARHRGWPVLLGASCAFAGLNLLAVLFGSAVAAWLPEWLTTLLVGLLFAAFGLHLLQTGEEDGDETVEPRSGHGLFVTTFLLIGLAEFGDKTQIAVAGLAGRFDALWVWVGATLALAGVSAIGVLAGRTFLQRLSLVWIHRASGVLFLALAIAAFYRLFAG